MMLIKKKNIKIIIWKKIFKINKNYLKNFKIVFELKNLKTKKNLFILNPLNGSHHSVGAYKINLKNTGWWNKIIKNFNNFKIICFSNLNSSYGSSNNKSKISLKFKKKFSFIKFDYKNNIKIKINSLKKIKIKKIYFNIGGSLGGVKNFILSIIYPKLVRFSLYIAALKKIFLKNKTDNKSCFEILKNKNSNLIKINFLYLKNLKIIRKLNNLKYLSKNDIIKKKKKILKKNLNFKKYKKKIFKYLNYRSNKFIKFYNIETYIFFLKNIKNFYIKNFFKNSKKNKNFIIVFKNDMKFKYWNSLKSFKFFLKIKKNSSIKILKSNLSHDSFLLNKKKYLNILKNIRNIRSDKIWTYASLIPNQVR